jgi:hypothetical protein
MWESTRRTAKRGTRACRGPRTFSKSAVSRTRGDVHAVSDGKGVEYDICAACRNDLKEWWAAADDGERSDLVLDDHGSEGDE